jgi:hypothetical protein
MHAAKVVVKKGYRNRVAVVDDQFGVGVERRKPGATIYGFGK